MSSYAPLLTCLLLAAQLEPDEAPFEKLHADPSWCGPRVLYFFSCYLGHDFSLEEIVDRCATDEEGFTSLRDLVRAAESLDLDPRAISCDADQLLSLGGPAIICVGRPDASNDRLRRIHFVGLIGRQGDNYLVIDPSLRAEPIPVSRDRIARSFTGKAVLLAGCPRPWILPFALPALFPILALTLGLVGAILLRLRPSRVRVAATGTEVPS